MLAECYYTDLNWYGTLTIILNRGENPLPDRLLDFIAFCVSWHERIDVGKNVEATEFDRYSDVVESGQWMTKAEDGTVQKIETPVFWSAGETCWRISES